MSFRRGRITPASSSRDEQNAPSIQSLNGSPHFPEYDPGVIAFPLRLTGHQALMAPARRWPTAPSVESDQTSNSAEERNPISSNSLDTVVPTAAPSWGGRFAATGGNQVPRNDYPRFNRAFPTPWVTEPQPRPAVASQHSRQSDEGYVPMGRWPTWYTRSILHPSVWAHQLEVTGISANYGGNIFLESNQSARIPEECSTSLWLTNLPPDCTHQMLLGAIRGCGKIYAAVINPPVYAANDNDYAGGGAATANATATAAAVPSRGGGGAQHSTAAAKLVFFDRAGLDKLMAKSQAGEFAVGGYVPRLRMNRIRSAPRPAGPQCRVLHIEGPSGVVNERSLGQFFQSKFKYELEGVLTLGSHGARTRQEWRFGSYRCQAESARQAINREKLRYTMTDAEYRLWSQVSVHFGVDPCAQD